MTPQSAKKIALLAVVVAASATYMREVTDPKSDASITRTVVAGIVLGMILTGTADFWPEVAGPFAVLILTVALARTVPDLAKQLNLGG